MKYVWLIILAIVFSGCQPVETGLDVTILDGSHVQTLQTRANTPAGIFLEAGLQLTPQDRVEYHGADLPLDFRLPDGGSLVLQIVRAHTLTLITPDTQLTIRSAAENIGEALAQTGLQLYSSDFIEPSPSTPLDMDMTVNYRPARDITLQVDDETIMVKSSQALVGQILASSGFALAGLDQSIPGPSEPVAPDGRISIKRIVETVELQEKAIPYTKKIEYSVDQPAGQQKVLQAGENGLAISRVRTRFENGKEITKTTDEETVIRQPRESVILLSTQAPVLTLDTPSGQIQYWRAVQMYATSYSPCRSGTSKCSYGTASGMPVKHGVVALVPALYNQLVGSKVYIPGYGIGVVGDVGGGFSDGRLWIDLGYSDDDYQSWSGYQTVYFLAPAPGNIPGVLR